MNISAGLPLRLRLCPPGCSTTAGMAQKATKNAFLAEIERSTLVPIGLYDGPLPRGFWCEY